MVAKQQRQRGWMVGQAGYSKIGNGVRDGYGRAEVRVDLSAEFEGKLDEFGKAEGLFVVCYWYHDTIAMNCRRDSWWGK